MKCIYCRKEVNGNQKTNEHVIPQWIIKELNIKDYKLNFIPVSRDLIAFKPRTPVTSTLTHKVCRNCNNGWLSVIDKSCTSYLKELMSGNISKDLMTTSNINKLYTLLYKIFLNHFATCPEEFKNEKKDTYSLFHEEKYPPQTVQLFISKLINKERNITIAHLDHWFIEAKGDNKYSKSSGFRFKFYLQLGKVAFLLCNTGFKNKKITYDPRFLIPLKCDKNITPKIINKIVPCESSVPDDFINHFLYNIVEIIE